jgi:uncharacterized membrane protein YphA (DoxX/SURF4 family)
MNHIHTIARFLLAFALTAIAIQQFIAGTVLIGRPPLQENINVEQIAAYCSALLLLAASYSIATGKLKSILVATSVFIILWSGVRNLLIVLTEGDIGSALTSVGKAFTLGSGILVLLIVHSGNVISRSAAAMNDYIHAFARICFGCFLVASGVQHFLFVDFVQSLVPGWIPAPVFCTYISAVALIVIGCCLVLKVKTELASLSAASMIFIWVFVIHIPRAIGINNQNEWTALFEATSFASMSFLLSQNVVPVIKTFSKQFVVDIGKD